MSMACLRNFLKFQFENSEIKNWNSEIEIAVSPRLQKSYKNKIGNKSDYPRPKDTQTRPNNQITEE